MQEYRRFTKDVGIVAFAQALMSLRGLVIIPILARTLGASLYGVYATLIVTVSLLSSFSALGLRQSIVRFLAGEKEREVINDAYSSILLFVLFISGIVSVSVFLSADLLAGTVFGDSSAGGVIRIGSSLILLWALDFVNLDFFRAFRRMFTMSVLQVFQSLGEVSLAAVFVLNGFGLEEVIYSFIAVRAIVLLVSFFLIVKDFGFRTPTFSCLPSYLSFGLPLLPIVVFGWVVSSSDRYVIGYFMSSFDVGVYSAAYGISSVVLLFMTAFNFVLFPALTQLWEEKRMAEFRTHLNYSLKYFLTLAIPSMVGLSVLSAQILRIMAGQEVVSSGVWVIPVVAAAMLLNGVYMLPMNILMAFKKTKPVLVGMLVSAALNLVLNIFLVPVMGVVGAAVSTLASLVFLLFAVLRESGRYFELPLDWVFILKGLTASFLMAALLHLMGPVKFVDVVFSIAIGAFIYFVLLFLLGGFQEKELVFFKDIAKRLKDRAAS